MNNNILSIKEVSKYYFNKNKITNAIKDITFDIKKNDFVAIIGPSGCGKSTILSIIGNLEKQTSGKLIHKNNIVIGYMFQDDALLPWLNILDNCLLGLKLQNKITDESLKYVKDLLKKYDLIDFSKNYPSELSGGMRQRVALIRTLALKPDILLLDEPFSALDYQTRIKISDDVYKIIKEEKKTAIMVTHDMAEAISMANKVVVLSKRPAYVKNIYNINIDNNKSPSYKRKENLFNKYHELIWEDFNSE